jgi:hypothetical protein
MYKVIDKEKILSDTEFNNMYELRDFLNKCCEYRGHELDEQELQEIKDLIPNMSFKKLKEELLIFNFQLI